MAPTHEQHSRQFLRDFATDIERLAKRIEETVALMENAGLEEMLIHRERSRTDGERFLKSWVDGLEDAFKEARNRSHKNAVSDSKNVSDSPRRKPKNKDLE